MGVSRAVLNMVYVLIAFHVFPAGLVLQQSIILVWEKHADGQAGAVFLP
jgi:hypothetical protein